jgi:hypothetical protein
MKLITGPCAWGGWSSDIGYCALDFNADIEGLSSIPSRRDQYLPSRGGVFRRMKLILEGPKSRMYFDATFALGARVSYVKMSLDYPLTARDFLIWFDDDSYCYGELFEL